MLTYDSTVVLQPTGSSIKDDPALQDLIASTAAYVGPGVGLDDLRANNAANVYLSICLGLQAAGVLSIQHVTALWIDIGDQAYKICFSAPGDALETSQDQPLDLNYTQSEQRRENSSKLLQARDPRCMHLRKESKRNQHMAGFLTAVETLVQCNDFSLAPATCPTAWELLLPSRNPNVPSPHDSQANETDPIRRVVYRLYRLEQLEKPAENLSLCTNNAYHAVRLAYKEAVETAVNGIHKSNIGRSKHQTILRAQPGPSVSSATNQFCLIVEIFGIKLLQAVPAVFVSKLERITIGKLVEVRDGDLYKEEVSRIQVRITHLSALRASIFKID
ncbi:hypothetical protein P389DRAFT_176267 [Cystobasidium minutum MCA 4210]|uniref:uncharacterized protein n=1 Tax=Cystobasidium minutum MCA 4210 TaxID=1397322 RepID=UPI0034CFCB54|eukprot:jgi/Rhomi1/176267/fgenesh1_kg.12_\